MTAIYKAFNDQQIACNDLPRQNSGCATVPDDRPGVGAIDVGDKKVTLNWSAVANADRYVVMRGEGGCEKGKVKINTISQTSFTDTGLKNGFEVSVHPKRRSFAFKIHIIK